MHESLSQFYAQQRLYIRIFIDVEKRSDSWRLILIDGVTPRQVQIRYSLTMGSDIFWRTLESSIFFFSHTAEGFFSFYQQIKIWRNKADYIAEAKQIVSDRPITILHEGSWVLCNFITNVEMFEKQLIQGIFGFMSGFFGSNIPRHGSKSVVGMQR